MISNGIKMKKWWYDFALMKHSPERHFLVDYFLIGDIYSSHPLGRKVLYTLVCYLYIIIYYCLLLTCA